MSEIPYSDVASIAENTPDIIKVLFFVYHPSVWDSHYSVYQAMKDSDYFEPYVFIAPVGSEEGQLVYKENIIEFFTKRDIPFILGYDKETGTIINIESLSMDVVFYQTPYYYGIPHFHFTNMVKYTRIAYIPYGIYTAGNQDLQFNLLFHNTIWKIFCETPLHKTLHAKYKITGDDNVIVTGYPKLDLFREEYQRNKEEAERMWKLPASQLPDVKHILWTPHWIVHQETKYTLFAEYIDFFTHYLQEHPTIEIILKPHPLLFETLLEEKVYTKEELEQRLARFESLPNASLYIGGDYYKLFFTSDAIINSSLSFMSEYLPTKKPMLFMPNSNDLGVNEFGEIIKKQQYLAYTPQDVENFIQDIVIEGNDTLYTQREECISEVLYFPPEGAGKRIAEEVRKALYQDSAWIQKQRIIKRKIRLAHAKEKAIS